MLGLGLSAQGGTSNTRPLREVYQSDYTKNVEGGKYFRTVESDAHSPGEYASTRDRSQRHRSTMKPREKVLAASGSKTRSQKQLPRPGKDAEADPRSKGRRGAIAPDETELQSRIDGMKVKIIAKNM